MYLVTAIVPAFLGLFLWMYLLTYFMHRGAGEGFFSRARWGFIRGMIVAGVFVFFDTVPFFSGVINHDWLIFPILFFLFSVPFSWRRLGKKTVIPIVVAFFVLLMVELFGNQVIFWSPFHEEIGKWYQSITNTYPALMSPFVSLGFAFVENLRYFHAEVSWGQILGRNLFSLPLHIFAGLLAFWCFFSLQSRILGIIIGVVAAITLHTLYNWSLNTSMIITLGIIIAGYLFYGWSLENGWWKKKI